MSRHISILFCILVFHYKFASPQKLPVTSFSPGNGALFSGVNSIFQDGQGWMWFTTTYDVIRYDGHLFKTYAPAVGVKMNFCYKILETNREIWVLADPYHLKVVGDSLQRLTINDIPAICGNITWKGHHYFAAYDGLYEFGKDGFRPLIRDTSLKIDNDENLFLLNDNLLLSYEWNKKIVIFDLKNKVIRSYPYPVYDMKQDKRGRIFILLNAKGIFEVKQVDKSRTNSTLELGQSLVIQDTRAEKFIIDSEDNFWIAIQDNYLLKTSPDKTTHTYKETDGLPGLWFHDLYQDREGNIWIGFNSGLCKIKNIHWKRYTINEGLYSNHIYFFGQVAGGSQGYMITRNGVNMIAENKIMPVKTVGEKPFACNYLLAEGRELFYLRDSALYTALLDTFTYRVNGERKLTGLPAKGLYLSKDRAGSLFIATDKGLFVYYNNRIENILNDTEHYHCTLTDSMDHLWAARFSGELLGFKINYKMGKLSLHLLHTAKQSAESIKSLKRPRTLAEDKYGNIYVGTRYDGLFYLSTKEDSINVIQYWTEKDKLKSNSVWGLATDQSGDCWVATAKGLNRISEMGSEKIIKDEGSTAQLYQASSVFVAKDNSVWIASHPGVVLLEYPIVSSGIFSTFITGVFMNGIRIAQGLDSSVGSKKFSYRENNFSINFSSNTFLDEEQVLYSYRLLRNGKGEWSMPGNIHSVNYPALLPGHYRFEVKSKNNRDIWSNNIASSTFKILPPFWQQAWFIILLVLVALALIYLLYRYRIIQLMKVQEMRNNISRNLHDDIGASLTNINILNTLAMRNLADKQKAEQWLRQAGEDIQQISESLSDIVWNINPVNDNLDNLLSYMKRYAADMLEGKNIAASLDFPPPGSRIGLSMEKRNDFFLIFKEAVNNLAKYSNAQNARILVRQEQNNIQILIEDNGLGFDMALLHSGNGLKNMQQRADNLNASLKIESSKGKGTRIELKMKI